MRPWVRGGVAIVAALATLTIGVQVLVIEPMGQAADQAARTAAAREAAQAAATVRAGGVPADGVVLQSRETRSLGGGGIAASGDGRMVWVPQRSTKQFVAALRLRLILLAVSAAIAVAGWTLWAGVIRRRDEEQAARRRVETIGMVAHDLRSPLTGIALAADRLARADIPAGRVAARAAIERECERLLGIADDILAVCCDSTARHANGTEESLSDVLEDVAARVRTAHGCPVVVEANLEARRLRADRRLARAVANVVENAARHSPPGHEVRLSAAVADDAIELVVEDAGEGFAPTFEVAAFRRGLRGGTAGLGLASSRRIVHRLGGSLLIGDRLGGGAMVSLRLPRRGAHQ